MFYVVIGIIAVLVIIVMALGLLRPKTFRVERSILINASAEDVYAVLTDFRKSASWSPWESKDLTMKKTFSGSETGKGAIFEWNGNNNVGHGRQEIVDAVPFSLIATQVDFFRPFKGRNMADFLLEPSNGSTRVRWVMHGPLNFIVRVLCFNMDRMIGNDFELGLSNLKVLLEK